MPTLQISSKYKFGLCTVLHVDLLFLKVSLLSFQNSTIPGKNALPIFENTYKYSLVFDRKFLCAFVIFSEKQVL